MSPQQCSVTPPRCIAAARNAGAPLAGPQVIWHNRAPAADTAGQPTPHSRQLCPFVTTESAPMSRSQCARVNASGSGPPASGAGGRRLRGRVVGRALDLLVASTALVAVAPVCLLIAILVKLDSKGPVFVTRVHFGRNGRRHSIAKFRTTRAGGRPHLVAVSALDTEGACRCNDPRLTRIGRLLRRLGLDELPTLWSVVLGDLSLVGPHPLMVRETAGAWKRRRFRVQPGVSSFWQNGPTGSPASADKVWQHGRSED